MSDIVRIAVAPVVFGRVLNALAISTARLGLCGWADTAVISGTDIFWSLIQQNVHLGSQGAWGNGYIIQGGRRVLNLIVGITVVQIKRLRFVDCDLFLSDILHSTGGGGEVNIHGLICWDERRLEAVEGLEILGTEEVCPATRGWNSIRVDLNLERPALFWGHNLAAFEVVVGADFVYCGYAGFHCCSPIWCADIQIVESKLAQEWQN